MSKNGENGFIQRRKTEEVTVGEYIVLCYITSILKIVKNTNKDRYECENEKI